MEFLTIKFGFAIILIWKCSCETFVTFGSHEYYFELDDRIRSITQAEEKCMEKNSQLAIVNKQEIQNFLVNQIIPVIRNKTRGPYSFFIGLKRFSEDKFGFQWNDGSLLVDGYSNWYIAEPNNGATGPDALSEDCVIMGWRYSVDLLLQWRDVVCNNILGSYICQRTLDLETTTQIIPTTSISTDEVTNISKIFSATTASLVIDRSTDSFLPTTELTDSAIATTAISSVESTTKNYPTTDLETTTQIIPTTSISTDEVTNISKIFSATTASLVIDRSTDSFLPTTELTDSAIATTAISSVESTTKYYPTTAQVTTIEGDLTTDVRLTSTAGTTSQSTRHVQPSSELTTSENAKIPSKLPATYFFTVSSAFGSTNFFHFTDMATESSSIQFTSTILEQQQTYLFPTIVIATTLLGGIILIVVLTFITKYFCKKFKKSESFEYDIENHRQLHNINTTILMEQETSGDDPKSKQDVQKEIYDLEEMTKNEKTDDNKNTEKETLNSTPIYAKVNKISKKQTTSV